MLFLFLFLFFINFINLSNCYKYKDKLSVLKLFKEYNEDFQIMFILFFKRGNTSSEFVGNVIWNKVKVRECLICGETKRFILLGTIEVSEYRKYENNFSIEIESDEGIKHGQLILANIKTIEDYLKFLRIYKHFEEDK